jgi:hypothetical protein
MLEFHQKHAIRLGSLERQNELLPIPGRDLSAEPKVLDMNEFQSFGDMGQCKLRVGEDQELFRLRVFEDLYYNSHIHVSLITLLYQNLDNSPH